MSLPPVLASLQLLSRATFQLAQGLINLSNSTTITIAWDETLRDNLHAAVTILGKLEGSHRYDHVIDLRTVQSLLEAMSTYGMDDSTQQKCVDDLEAAMKHIKVYPNILSSTNSEHWSQAVILALNWAISCLVW